MIEPGDTVPSCREAGEECARTCWGVRLPAVPASVLACLECDFGSGCLKKESGSFLILMGNEGGKLAVFGFMTALNSASRSVSESPRTWMIWWPTGGLCWLGSMLPKTTKNSMVSEFTKRKKKKSETKCSLYLNPTKSKNQMPVLKQYSKKSNILFFLSIFFFFF